MLIQGGSYETQNYLLAELLADQTESEVRIDVKESSVVANERSNHSRELCNNDKPTMGATVGGSEC